MVACGGIIFASDNCASVIYYHSANRMGNGKDFAEDFLGAVMRKKQKKQKAIPALGPEFCQIFKRKAGAHSHKNVKRKKTRQKFLRLREIMREY